MNYLFSSFWRGHYNCEDQESSDAPEFEDSVCKIFKHGMEELVTKPNNFV